MPKLVCSSCQLEYTVKKTGVHVVEYAEFGPYKLWEADEWECPGCGATICAGFGDNAISEHYESKFQQILDKFTSTPDCRYDFENERQRDRFTPFL